MNAIYVIFDIICYIIIVMYIKIAITSAYNLAGIN